MGDRGVPWRTLPSIVHLRLGNRFSDDASVVERRGQVGGHDFRPLPGDEVVIVGRVGPATGEPEVVHLAVRWVRWRGCVCLQVEHLLLLLMLLLGLTVSDPQRTRLLGSGSTGIVVHGGRALKQGTEVGNWLEI